MFGYVRPFKGEMLVKEYDAYKGVYCQLCRALGKYYGFPMRLTLSYDCTLYAEHAKEISIDRCSAPTAEMLQTICAELGSNAGEKAVLSEVGYFLGRWIYIMDAADDLTDDLLQQKFNPFIQKLGLESSRGLHLLPEERKRADEECNAVLNGSLARLLPAVNLLPSGKFTRILENIFEKGLPEMQREILFLHIKKEKRHD